VLRAGGFRFGAVVTGQSPINVERVGVVSLNEVAVVAIHRAYEVADAFLNDRMEAACEGIAPGDEIDSKVG
jgi:hypothetical protein